MVAAAAAAVVLMVLTDITPCFHRKAEHREADRRKAAHRTWWQILTIVDLTKSVDAK